MDEISLAEINQRLNYVKKLRIKTELEQSGEKEQMKEALRCRYIVYKNMIRNCNGCFLMVIV